MTTDYRALCAELIDALVSTGEAASGTYSALLIRARAVLAQPEPEVRPSDEELDALWFEIDGRQGLGWKSFARAVLARFGHQPEPPAEGEVAGLVEWLRMQGEAQKPGPNSLLSDRTKNEKHTAGMRLTRAADLLEQRHPVPVPVAERLPGPEDCDEMGQCWWFDAELWCLDIYDHEYTHWLPAHALPLPSGEVEHD